MKNDLELIVRVTQRRLNEWYKNAEIDYKILGGAIVFVQDNNIVIESVDNGIKNIFEMNIQELDGEENEYLFNVWMEG